MRRHPILNYKRPLRVAAGGLESAAVMFVTSLMWSGRSRRPNRGLIKYSDRLFIAVMLVSPAMAAGYEWAAVFWAIHGAQPVTSEMFVSQRSPTSQEAPEQSGTDSRETEPCPARPMETSVPAWASRPSDTWSSETLSPTTKQPRQPMSRAATIGSNRMQSRSPGGDVCGLSSRNPLGGDHLNPNQSAHGPPRGPTSVVGLDTGGSARLGL